MEDNATHAEPTTPCNILQLPPEVLINIFAYLGTQDKERAADVHSSWRDALLHKQLWKNGEIEIDLRKPPSTTQVATWIRRGIDKLTVLECSRKTFLHHVFPDRNSLTTLKTLTITASDYLTDDMMCDILSFNMPNLVHLDLRNCHCLSNTFYSQLAVNLPQLIRLRLGHCYNLDDKTARFIHAYMRKLTSIQLGISHDLTNVGIKTLTAGSPDHAPLTELILAECMQVNEGALEHLWANQSGLKVFDFWPGPTALYPSMVHLSKVRGLNKLTLHSVVPMYTEDWVGPLSSGLWNVTHLCFMDGAVHKDGLFKIAQLSNLETLTLDHFEISTMDYYLRNLVKYGSQIKHLVLRGLGITDDCMSLVGKFSHLQTLTLSGCWLITTKAIDNLAQGHAAITTLVVNCCPKINYTVLRVMPPGTIETLYTKVEQTNDKGEKLVVDVSTLGSLQSPVSDGGEKIFYTVIRFTPPDISQTRYSEELDKIRVNDDGSALAASTLGNLQSPLSDSEEKIFYTVLRENSPETRQPQHPDSKLESIWVNDDGLAAVVSSLGNLQTPLSECGDADYRTVIRLQLPTNSELQHSQELKMLRDNEYGLALVISTLESVHIPLFDGGESLGYTVLRLLPPSKSKPQYSEKLERLRAEDNGLALAASALGNLQSLLCDGREIIGLVRQLRLKPRAGTSHH